MKTKKMWAVIAVVLAFTGLAWAAEQVERMGNTRPVHMGAGVYIGPDSVLNVQANKVTRAYGKSGTIDFTSTTVGRAESSGITVYGARTGDPCFVGVPAAAGALAAQYSCYVSAADTVKVVFAPLSQQQGTAQFDAGSPAQIDVTGITASSVCFCTPIGTTAAIAAGGCAASLSSTTLTMTGPNSASTVVSYRCTAPVDPASGTYYVRVLSGQ